MKRPRAFNWLLFGLGSALPACAPLLAPPTPYVPLVRARGEAELHLGAGLSGNELQAAYAATDALVLTAAGNSYRRARAGHRLFAAELGAVRHWQTKPHLSTLLGGGAGVGGGFTGVDNGWWGVKYDRDRYVTYRSRYTYAYLQPALALRDGSGGALTVTTRLSYVVFDRLEATTVYFFGPTVQANRAGQQTMLLQPAIAYWQDVNPIVRWGIQAGAQVELGHHYYASAPPPQILQLSLTLKLPPR